MDLSLKDSSGGWGWGVVARNEDGVVIAAKAGCSDAIHNAFTAELLAMEEAFNLAAELGVIRLSLKLTLNS
jgi:hypothetical protein